MNKYDISPKGICFTDDNIIFDTYLNMTIEESEQIYRQSGSVKHFFYYPSINRFKNIKGDVIDNVMDYIYPFDLDEFIANQKSTRILRGGNGKQQAYDLLYPLSKEKTEEYIEFWEYRVKESGLDLEKLKIFKEHLKNLHDYYNKYLRGAL